MHWNALFVLRREWADLVWGKPTEQKNCATKFVLSSRCVVDGRLLLFFDSRARHRRQASWYPQDALPTFGHSLRGTRARAAGFGPREGGKVTCLLATDVNVGVVAWWLFEGNTCNATFYLFLALFVFPAIRGQRRVVLFDNLSAHFGANIDQLFAWEGHIWVARPIHSPDFGYIEWSFNWITMYLKHHFAEIEAADLALWIADAIAHIRPGHVQGFAADAHFFVPGRAFHPYLIEN